MRTESGLRTLFLMGVIWVAAAPAVWADFQYADFSSTAGLSLVGTATTFDNDLRLTPATANASGGAWYSAKQGVQSGFQTAFDFNLSGGQASSDGFAFLV